MKFGKTHIILTKGGLYRTAINLQDKGFIPVAYENGAMIFENPLIETRKVFYKGIRKLPETLKDPRALGEQYTQLKIREEDKKWNTTPPHVKIQQLLLEKKPDEPLFSYWRRLTALADTA